MATMMTAAAAPSAYTGFDTMPIGGTWRAGRSGTIGRDTNPYTGETLVKIPLANADDVAAAYEAAKRAQRGWFAQPPQARSAIIARAADILDARKDEVADWLIREAGSTRIKAEVEVQLVLGGIREAASYPARMDGEILTASIPGKESYVFRQPVGVVGIISPWNFPLQLANRSIAPALATGNAIVVKPATDTPVTGGLLLAKIYEEAGVPPGVFNVVIGAGSDIGDAMVTHPIPRVISFTGSTPVGEHIGELAGKHVKRVCLELGGNAPAVVLHDADLDVAVNAIAFGKFMHQGQICMAINRIIVDGRVYDDFVERFTRKVATLKSGDPSDPKTVIGPIINDRQIKHLNEIVKKIKATGARVALNGGRDGAIFRPMVLADVKNEDAQDELFGPVALIIRADGDDDALRIANDVEFGLSSCVFSRDIFRAIEFGKRMEAGMSHVNDASVNDEPNTAFGGEKKSGIGRFGGEWAIREFTTDHWVSVQKKPREYPF